jgi:hypothetical protein
MFSGFVNSSVFAGDPGLQFGEEGERIESPATPDFAEKFLKTDEPGEAKDESTLAETGHREVPRALARWAPYLHLKTWPKEKTENYTSPSPGS